jgi:nitrogenase subunit NifH
MTHRQLHQLLRVASHLMDQAATEVRATDLGPVDENIQRIGRALIEVIEVQRRIYAAQPELQPKTLAATARESDANRLFTQVTMEALELEDAGNPEAAREKYTEFIGLSPSYHHREIARSEIRRLS